MELIATQVVDLDFVWDSPQKGLVTKLSGFDIAGKDHKQVEGNLKLFPSREVEKIDPSVERNNPAVEQCFRAHQLTAEVVHDQHTVVRLHLKRRGVNLTDRVEMEI